MNREQMLEEALRRAIGLLSIAGSAATIDEMEELRAALSTPAEPRTVEPLTNADVVEGWRTTEALRDDYGWTSCEWFQAGVRFAQRHYGIGLVLAGGEQG